MVKMLCLFLVLQTTAFAAGISVSVNEKKEVGAFSVGVGSAVTLKSDDEKLNGAATFLGKVIHSDGSESYQMYLDKKGKKVYYIDASDFARKNSKLQTVIDPYEQAGGTCTAYAIYGFLQQTHLSGFEGTGELATTLASEDTRTHLLADAINEYYLTPAHRYSIRGILDKYGKKFGFKCKKFQTDTYESAKAHVMKQLDQGSPVIVSFNIGPKMVQSPFKLEMYGHTKPEIDGRLWIPRKVGERNSGGHTILAAASFTHNERLYFVMVDSDWSEPRIWDAEETLNNKTAVSEIEFVTCK
ncbi:hypothetical protein C0V70_06360 [Bacteriovorax stolpii]|uniref:Uncharacterized protein n=1 Tax=Bacteriovorax stolpii TaxID=960 RepID=A0A2K9NQE9_BACTC|nr:hypothetical protein [Bacteriovorax stolpii]AUN97739.1 hypothetical protein C0V70_06360 [Bacteriovorax stolpii]TDP51559.1 hypothetical protein C8D79_3003 [Bacteriovorax stolpii]